MIMTKLYEDNSNEMTAVVFEDGRCVNFVPCPEIAALDGDSFFDEARLGFPDAVLYEYDTAIGLTTEEAAAREELESTLIACIGDKITIYPQRMSPEQQEFFQLELGDDIWNALMEQDSDGGGIELEL